ncbi:hypothetical protein GCM10008959_26200 [Deinococcus seoulensis]|uniref:Uncharacterized protein n=1 Tax=Deinococcus seoulensis TaxID=1837379 RepID=A0ABQ2RUC1_9DEIO|nr:hypothetical protein [Deinococcus seoulensis]GGR62902.1 hypothetical protein GCM10008959_26200 [Deinococcus seoulensis]
MTGPGRPVGPEGRTQRVQAMLTADVTTMAASSPRGLPAMIRHALRMQHALDTIGPLPDAMTEARALADLQLVRDLHRQSWHALTHAARFSVSVTGDRHSERGPVYAWRDGQFTRAETDPDPEPTRLYLIHDALYAPDYQFQVAPLHVRALERIHANPEAMTP